MTNNSAPAAQASIIADGERQPPSGDGPGEGTRSTVLPVSSIFASDSRSTARRAYLGASFFALFGDGLLDAGEFTE